MSTFTVYCHGTGFNRIKGTDSDELVAWFHNHTDGTEATLGAAAVTRGDYMINEGPGHSGNGISQPQQINPVTGNHKQNLSLGKTIKGPSFGDHLIGNTGGPKVAAKLRGMISGQGWDENVIRTVNIIQDLKFGKGVPIDTVNMVGWSRGAHLHAHRQPDVRGIWRRDQLQHFCRRSGGGSGCRQEDGRHPGTAFQRGALRGHPRDA